jgi:hypothetical protein
MENATDDCIEKISGMPLFRNGPVPAPGRAPAPVPPVRQIDDPIVARDAGLYIVQIKSDPGPEVEIDVLSDVVKNNAWTGAPFAF